MAKITSLDNIKSSKSERKKRASKSKVEVSETKPRKSSKSKSLKVSSKKKPRSKDIESELKSKDIKKKKKKKKKKLSERALERKRIKEAKLTTTTASLDRQFDQVASNLTIKEAEQLQEYVEIFTSLRDISRIKEQHCRDHANAKDIYALMKLYDQMREVIADIRTIRDVSGVVVTLRDDVINPMMQSAANEIVNINQTMRQFILKYLQGDEALTLIDKLNELSAKSGDALHESYLAAIDMTAITLEQQ